MNSLFKITTFLFLGANCSAVYLFGCSYRSYDKLCTSTMNGDDLRGLYGRTILKPAVFNDLNVFNNVTNRIGQIVSTVLAENVFNTVESMHRFWIAFQKSFSRKCCTLGDYLEYFHSKYRPEYHSNSGSVGLLVTILLTFIKEYKEYKDNVYLASVYSKAPDSFSQTVAELDELPSSFQMKDIAGVFKFELAGKLGYVLIVIDPEDGSSSQVIIMNEEIDVVKRSGNMKFNKFRSGYPHLIHSEKIVLPPSLSFTDNNHYFYNIKRPFCSIVLAVREELLNARRVLIKKDDEGNHLASIYFNMLPFNETPVFFVEDEQKRTYTVPFEFYSTDEGRSQINRILRKVENIMGIDSNELFFKVQLRDVLHDTAFMRYYSALVNGKVPGSASDSTDEGDKE